MTNNCDHSNFDEYFGKCTDCNADRHAIIKENIITELQGVYEKQLEALGIGGGYLDKTEHPNMAKAEERFAEATASWIDHLYETVE